MVVDDDSYCTNEAVQVMESEGELRAVLHAIDKLGTGDEDEEGCVSRKITPDELEEGSSITKDSGNDEDDDDGQEGATIDGSDQESFDNNVDDQQLQQPGSDDQFVELDLTNQDSFDGSTPKIDTARSIEDQSENNLGLNNDNHNGTTTLEIANGCDTAPLSKAIALAAPIKDKESANIEIKLDGDGCDSIDDKAQKLFANCNGDGNTNANGNAHFCKKTGFIRHFIAILALSSIVLANINRQAFNQALVSMTKKAKSASQMATEIVDAGLTSESPTTIQANTIKYFYYSSYETTSDFAPTQEPQTELDSKFNASKPPPLGINDTVEKLVQTVSEPSVTVVEVDEENDDRFDWTEAQVGVLQSAFSYGYMPFMIPGGRMSEIYGAKWVVFLSGFGSAICCLIIPFLADTSYGLLVCSRIFMGFCQTGVSPALYALLTRWLPPEESSVYLPMIKVGVMIGYMSGALISGFFTWRFTFYFVALIGILWSTLWVFMATSDPKEHKLIGKDELSYIQFELEKLNKGKKMSAKESRKQSAPWIRIVTNPVVLSFMLAKFTVKLSTDAQSMQIPMYLKKVFRVSAQLNGILSATNFAIQGLFTGLVAYVAKEFVVRKTFGLNKTGVRRLFQGINNFGMAFGYILMSFNMGSLNIVCCSVIVLSVASMFGAGGEAVTPIDLSTEYSASIMAIANSCANLSGIVQPPLVALLLGSDPLSPSSWNFVWRTLGATLIGGGLMFSFLVNAKIQDFNPKEKEVKGGDDTNNKKPEVIIEMKAVKS